MKALYTAATGMNAQTHRLDNVANNLANVNTTAYKRSTTSFQDLFYEELSVGGADQNAPTSNAQIGGGVQLSGVVRNHDGGSLVYTGDPLNAAIVGDGLFEITNEAGEIFYTRDGTFRANADGLLVTTHGHTVGSGIDVSGYERVEIRPNGSVVGMDDQGMETTVGEIAVTAFSNPSALEAIGGNLYRPTEKAGEPIDITLGENGNELHGGHLEGSNVDVARELIDMIQAQRAYELTSKVVQAADETLQTAVNLRR